MANTINWNIPNIKSSKISATNSAYTNPQYPIADQFSMWGKVASNLGKSVAMGIQARTENQRREKAEQLNLLKRRNAMTNAQYDKVAQISPIGGNEFETSKNNMLYGLKDQYVEIKLAMEDGRIDNKEGALALQQINASVKKYKDQAPFILAAANELNTALGKKFGTTGAIASATPTPQQELLMSLTGDGKVGIKDYQGEYYLYKTGEDEDGNPIEFDPKSLSVLNIDQFLKETDGGKNPGKYYQTIIDTTAEQEGAVRLFFDNPNTLNATYVTPVETISDDGKKEILSYNWKKKDGHAVGKEALLKNMDKTAWNFITNPETPEEIADRNNLWNDVVGKTKGADGKWASGQDTVFDPNSTEKKIREVPGEYMEDGTFRFDPEGKKMKALIDHATGEKLPMTDMEFMKRYYSEIALQANMPSKINTISSVSDVPKTNEKTKNWKYRIDKAINSNTPKISGKLAGKEALWILDNDVYTPHVLDSKGALAPYPEYSIKKYKEDKNGNPIMKEGEKVINYAALHEMNTKSSYTE